MDTLLADVRDAVRAFRRDLLYVAAVVATLALTLGASTAVFSIVNGVLLRPLAFPEPERLVSVREILPSIAQQYPTLAVNARHFEEWRREAKSFAAIAQIEWRTTTMTGAGEPAQLSVVRASGTLFDVLQMPVALGRPLTQADEAREHPPVALISERLWEDRFGRDAGVLGRTIVLGGLQYTIVGVLPAAHELPRFNTLNETASLSSGYAAVVPFRLNFANIGWMGQFNYAVIARLKPGVTLEQARAEMNVIQASVADIASKQIHEFAELRAWMSPLDEAIVGRARAGLLLLLGAIAGVVLIACANLANLSLTRALARMRDSAVRSALGATRARLVRSVIVEQVMLALIGGALGLLLALTALGIFVKTAPIDVPRLSEAAIDGRVLAYAVATIAAATA
jgi:predicted permease